MSLSDMLTRLCEELDVPDKKYEEATAHYNAVADWLRAEGSPLASLGVTLHTQGSFALGTAIKPAEDGEYDVDAVCLIANPPVWTQRDLKEAVGSRLKSHKLYREMLNPPDGGRRCWTLKYADGSQFHLDVLPAIPDNYDWLLNLGIPIEYARTAIQITCRDCYDDPTWPKSNPKGYLAWFVSRMRVRFAEARAKLAAARRTKVEDVPEYATRTPLQRVVQILKRQRDVMFGDDADRPISIIITTLAAKAYGNETDLEQAYRAVVRGMRSKLEHTPDGHWAVHNPVNSEENFADQWTKFPDRQEKFFAWLDAVETTERDLSADETFEKRADVLMESFGAPAARAAGSTASKFVGSAAAGKFSEIIQSSMGLHAILASPHRTDPKWPVENRYSASVSARAHRDGFRTVRFSDKSPSPPLAKGLTIDFRLRTDVPRPFSVQWQVVNTGEEARRDGGLRGGFNADDVAHTESTKYKGRHFVQAYVIKDGVCVATSKPVFVIIK